MIKISIIDGLVVIGDVPGSYTIEVTQEQISMIQSGRGEIIGGEFSEIEIVTSDEELTELKRQEMQSLIDFNYPLENRLTYLSQGALDTADTDFAAMNTYINGIKAEFDANGKDADFTARM